MQRQLDELAVGAHLHQRSLESLVEDGSYHDRLRRDVPEFLENPYVEPRPIPMGLSEDPMLMVAMDQFKDVAGYVRYASRLQVSWYSTIASFLALAVNETVGEAFGVRVGRKTLELDACDPEFVSRHLPSDP